MVGWTIPTLLQGLLGHTPSLHFGMNGKHVLLSIELTESICSPHA